MRTSINKSLHRVSVFAAFALVLSAVNVEARDPGNRGADKLLGLDAKPVSEAYVVRLVARSLPTWDRSVLEAEDNESPLKQLSFYDIANIVDDQDFDLEIPDGATQVEDDARAIKNDPRKGKLRYVNRKRAWRVDEDGDSEAIDRRTANKIAVVTLEKIGIPRDTVGKPDIQIQRALGGKAGARQPSEQYDMYRVVQMQRMVNGLPVFDSGYKVAITNEGEIQRLGLNWPDFALGEERRLRSRRDIVEDAVKQIMDNQPRSDVKINTRLGYTRVNGEFYKPVLVMAVESQPTPYLLTIEITQPDKPDSEEI